MGFSLIVILPLAYITAWLYFLITWAIPMLSVPFGDIVTWTIWGLISLLAFFTLGIVVLVICIGSLIMILAS